MPKKKNRKRKRKPDKEKIALFTLPEDAMRALIYMFLRGITGKKKAIPLEKLERMLIADKILEMSREEFDFWVRRNRCM